MPLTYSYNAGSQTYSVTGDCTAGALVIPSTATDGINPVRPVTSIGNNAFFNCTSLTSITIPDSVTSIGFTAFSNCTNLTTVTIGSGVTSIGIQAFNFCTGLNKFTINGNTLQTIGDSAFNTCRSLTGFPIPNSVTTIGSLAFYSCIDVSGGLVIPDSVTNLGSSVFGNCFRLKSVNIGTGLLNISTRAFADCAALTGVTIGNNVSNIEAEAFDNCDDLPSITIPSGVTNIGFGAFGNSNNFTGFNVNLNNLNYSNDTQGILYNKSQTSLEAFPAGRTNWNILNSLTNISDSAFEGARLINFIDLPNSVTGIGPNAFRNSAITGINIPNGITYIEDNTFRNCSNLTNIFTPNTVTGIGNLAFNFCVKLSSITIPNSIKSIGNSAFQSCSILTGINFLGDAPITGTSILASTPASLKIYRYSTKSNWSSTFGGKDVLLIDSPIHKGFQSFGFLRFSAGKVPIKKQNLSILKSSAFYPESESNYIFKSPVNNILANIFNYLQFVDYSEAVTIYYEGSFSGQSIDFYSDGSGWTDIDTFENRNNYVIPANSLIIITLNSDKNITVGGGAIIQKYYSGKITLKKS
jgi:hypothetical protein